MSVFVVSGSNAPETTCVVMGQFETEQGTKDVNIDVNAILDPNKKAVYDAFFNLVGSNVSVELINSDFEGSFNHVTPENVDLNAIVIDYSLLSQQDKDIINNAFALLNSVE